jgi:hypothetical protein
MNLTAVAVRLIGNGPHPVLISIPMLENELLMTSIRMIRVIGIGPLPTCLADYKNESLVPKDRHLLILKELSLPSDQLC